MDSGAIHIHIHVCAIYIHAFMLALCTIRESLCRDGTDTPIKS